MYKYYVYGISVYSEFEINELESKDNICGNTEVFICYRDTPCDVKYQISKGKHYDYNRERFWFHIPDVATYFITDKKICIEPHCDNNSRINVYLLGSALGGFLIINNIIAIHGSSIIAGNECIIISGDSGSGKSTLASGFIEKGYKFISDDVSRVYEKAKKIFFVNPAFSQRKLCSDSILQMGYELDECTLFDEIREKYLVESKENFIYKSIKLGAIFEINIGDEFQNDVVVEEVNGYEKLKVILKNIFRIEIAYKIGFSKEYFNVILGLVNQVKVYKILRPRGKFTIDKQMDKVLEKMECV